MKSVTFKVDTSEYLLTDTGIITNLTTGRVLKGWIGTQGYRQVTLGSLKNRALMHRLLGTYFIDNPNKYPEINHKDGNKLNNSLNNLEWVLPVDNIRHAFSNNLTKHKAIIDYTQIPDLLSKFYSGITFKELQIELGIKDYSSLRKLLKRQAIRDGDLDKFLNTCKKHRNKLTKIQSKKVKNSLGMEYPSLNNAARACQCNPASIYKAIKANKPYQGIYWNYV